MIASLARPLIAVLTITLLGTAGALAAPTVRYHSASAEQALQVDGTSNIHDWSARTSSIIGWIELPGQWEQTSDGLRLGAQLRPTDVQPRLEVQIPVRSLKSGKSGLDDNMYKAMAAKRHPHVAFVLTRVSPQEAAAADAGAVRWRATGDLTIAGTTRSVELDMTLEPMRDDGLKITVEKALKMTDFGIDPPTAMFGMARAADQVTVKATWMVQRQTPQPTIPSFLAPAAYRQRVWRVLEAYGRAGQALAANAWPEPQRALEDLAASVALLVELDGSDLPEAQRAPWQEAAARLREAPASAAEARELSAARAVFAVLTEAVTDVIALIGFDYDAPITAYRHAGQRGVAGSPWLHVPMTDRTGQPLPVRSPYGSATAGSAEPVALYLPAPVTLDESEVRP